MQIKGIRYRLYRVEMDQTVSDGLVYFKEYRRTTNPIKILFMFYIKRK